MRICFITGQLSPHELPVMRELAAGLGLDNFRYIVAAGISTDRSALGWAGERHSWLIQLDRDADRATEADQWIREADLAFFGDRDHPLMEWRVNRGRQTLYGSERWFKPPIGMMRLLHPRYLLRARRLVRLIRSSAFHYLPVGIHAATDGARICALFAGQSVGPGCGRNPMLLWGYFVSPSEPLHNPHRRTGQIRVLWVGRMLGWKLVDTLIQAVGRLVQCGIGIQLTLVGQGPEELRLRRLAGRVMRAVGIDETDQAIRFYPSIPINEVRLWMREADVYVLPSNGYEGWGTVVNEAMLEGCALVATREAGSSGTLIRDDRNGLLFHSGSVAELTAALARLEADEPLRQRLAAAGQKTVRTLWVPEVAAERLLALSEALIAGRTPPVYAEGPLQPM